MKCPKCNGTGDIPRPNGTKLFGLTEVMTCDLCKGVGEVEMTNEEWFCGLRTEEKAEFFVKIEMSAMHPVKRGAVDMEKFIEDVVEWLKQPHKD